MNKKHHRYEVYTGMKLLRLSTDDYNEAIGLTQQLGSVHREVRLYEKGREIVRINKPVTFNRTKR